jgi:16S rRNA (adenine1518-N6/adenine1519-N6)-dimethyltransferase
VHARSSRRRALGQHFLVDGEVAHRTVAFAELAPGASVLEIGPGRGALTEHLLAAGHRVVAVELDAELAEALDARREPRLRVLRGDFLRLALDALPPGPLPVVANLPYSTGTAIVTRLVEHPLRFPRVVVMLQLEVAQRICAEPGSRSYGSLTVLTALHAAASFGFVVPPRAFAPPPEVDSAVLRLDLQPEPRADVGDPRVFRRVVRAAFAQRRKTLRNALGAQLGLDAAVVLLERAGIDARRRAETLSLDEFALLSREAAALEAGSGAEPARDA